MRSKRPLKRSVEIAVETTPPPTKTDLAMIKHILKKWQKDHADRFGGGLPQSYCCIDLETTGFDKNDDLIVELGWCLVDNKQVCGEVCIVLDWTRSEFVPQDWLTFKLDRCRKSMESNGRQYHMSIKRMQKEGQQPEEGLYSLFHLLESAREQKLLLVGHNLLNFDAPRLVQAFKEWIGETWVFDENEIIDTAAIEKANLMGVGPMANESLSKYFKRVLSMAAPGVFYNLDKHCVERYELVDKYDLDMSKAHTAGFDAYLTHLLFEEFRKISER